MLPLSTTPSAPAVTTTAAPLAPRACTAPIATNRRTLMTRNILENRQTSNDVIRALGRSGIDLHAEYAALTTLRDNAAMPGYSQHFGHFYFDKQYGSHQKPIKQLIAIYEEFGLLPTELISSGQEMAFVNAEFAKQYKELSKKWIDKQIVLKDLRRIPTPLKHHKHIKKLEIRGICSLQNDIPLTHLPEWLKDFSTLRELTLNNTLFSEPPNIIRHLTQLTCLAIHDNHFITLPDWIGEMTALEQIYINDSELHTLPDALATLPNLREIHANRNHLSPEEQTRFQALLSEDTELTAVQQRVINSVTKAARA